MEGIDPKLLKDKVAAGQITTGALATDLLWPGLVECLMGADLDYLIIDQEHGVHEDKLVAEVCALGRMVDSVKHSRYNKGGTV